MPKSAAFARIQLHTLAAARTVPRGRVTTYAAIAASIRVVPRHVAYILATLPGDEGAHSEAVPWHRVVGDDGEVTALRSRANRERGLVQVALLEAEGVKVVDGRIPDFAARFVDIAPHVEAERPWSAPRDDGVEATLQPRKTRASTTTTTRRRRG